MNQPLVMENGDDNDDKSSLCIPYNVYTKHDDR